MRATLLVLLLGLAAISGIAAQTQADCAPDSTDEFCCGQPWSTFATCSPSIAVEWGMIGSWCADLNSESQDYHFVSESAICSTATVRRYTIPSECSGNALPIGVAADSTEFFTAGGNIYATAAAACPPPAWCGVLSAFTGQVAGTADACTTATVRHYTVPAECGTTFPEGVTSSSFTTSNGVVVADVDACPVGSAQTCTGYAWTQTDSWSACEVDGAAAKCGTGVQEMTQVCQCTGGSDAGLNVEDHTLCGAAPAPVRQLCNTWACPHECTNTAQSNCFRRESPTACPTACFGYQEFNFAFQKPKTANLLKIVIAGGVSLKKPCSGQLSLPAC